MMWLAVMVGGALGAPARFLLDRAVTDRVTSTRTAALFPWGLLVVNVLGSAAAGIVIATTAGDLRVLLLAGFCGAFTTFSGYAWETDRLWWEARPAFWAAALTLPIACTTAFLIAWRLAGIVAG